MSEVKTYLEIEAGTIVPKQEGGELKFLTIHRVKFSDYTLPKGHLEVGESLEETAERETYEETGYKVKVGDIIDSFEYKVKGIKNREEAFIIRRVYYFLGDLNGDIGGLNHPEANEGEIMLNWLSYEEALSKFTYDTDKSLLGKARLLIK